MWKWAFALLGNTTSIRLVNFDTKASVSHINSAKIGSWDLQGALTRVIGIWTILPPPQQPADCISSLSILSSYRGDQGELTRKFPLTQSVRETSSDWDWSWWLTRWHQADTSVSSLCLGSGWNISDFISLFKSKLDWILKMSGQCDDIWPDYRPGRMLRQEPLLAQTAAATGHWLVTGGS